MATLPRSFRLQAFLERLVSAAPASSHDEARSLLANILNAVEDEYSGVPFNPANWAADGRLYPPQDDRASDDDDIPGVVVYRSRAHTTLIGPNGAIEIQRLDGTVELSKPGADGNGVRP